MNAPKSAVADDTRLIRAIMAESGCSLEVAYLVQDEIERASKALRSQCWWYVDPDHHTLSAVLRIIMPVGRIKPKPGSAQAIIVETLLRPGEPMICQIGHSGCWQAIMLLRELPAPPPGPVAVLPLNFSGLLEVRPFELHVTFWPWAIDDLRHLLAMHRDGVISLGRGQAELFRIVINTGSWWDNIGKFEPLARQGREHMIRMGPHWNPRRFIACLGGALAMVEIH